MNTYVILFLVVFFTIFQKYIIAFKDPESFSWKQYLAKTESVPAPARAFKPRPAHKFEVGMKLEAVDKRVSTVNLSNLFID